MEGSGPKDDLTRSLEVLLEGLSADGHLSTRLLQQLKQQLRLAKPEEKRIIIGALRAKMNSLLQMSKLTTLSQ